MFYFTSLRVVNCQRPRIFVLETILYKIRGLDRFLINLKVTYRQQRSRSINNWTEKMKVILTLALFVIAAVSMRMENGLPGSGVAYNNSLGIICCFENSY